MVAVLTGRGVTVKHILPCLAFALLLPASAFAQGRWVTFHAAAPERPSAAVAAFSATRILDVQLVASFDRRLRGDHLLEVKLYTPKGSLYQVLSIPFTGDEAGARRRQVRLGDHPHPVALRGMKTHRDRFHVEASLPVAGTWIVASSMYGRWRADASLDGSRSLLASTRFTINP